MPFLPTDMKDLNRKAVFELIAGAGEISRVEIEDTLGISAPTVLKITNFLLERGFVSISGKEKTVRGRHPYILRFNPDHTLAAGIDYNGKQVRIGIVNYWGDVVACREAVSGPQFDLSITQQVPQILEQLIQEENICRENLYGIGIGIPASVDTDNAGMELGPLSGILTQRPVKECLSALSGEMGVPAYIFNDVNAAARGEYIRRKLKNDDLVYISFDVGLGAGIILDGKLRTGKHFYTGEIGHIIFDASFRTEIDRPGWMERELSSAMLAQRFPGYTQETADDEVVDYIAKRLGLCISNICNILDVEFVVLGGGGVAALGERLYRETRKYVDRLGLFQIDVNKPECENATVVGAASMTLARELNRILADPSTP